MSDAARGRPARAIAWFRADRTRVWIALATLVGFVLRVVWAYWVHRPPAGLYDPARYVGYARGIAHGKGYVELFGQPTSYYPPGYPWFLGIVAWLARPFTDDVALVGGLVQAVLGALTATLGAYVARRLSGARAAVAAAVVLALYPNLVFHSGAILGETLYDFLFVAFLAVVFRRPWADGFTARRGLFAGLLLGLAVMVRPISLAIVPVVLACWWWQARRTHAVPGTVDPDDLGSDGVAAPSGVRVARTTGFLRPGVLLVVGVVACIVPWTVRNEIRLHHLVLISNNTGDNFCIGHGPGATGAFRGVGPDDPCTVKDPKTGKPYNLLDGPDSEVAADKAKLRVGIDGMKGQLGHEPWMTWNRFYVTWIRDGDHDAVNAVQAYRTDRWIAIPTEARLYRVADVAYWIVAPLGVAGLVVLVRRRRPEGIFLVGATVMTALVPLAFFGDSRFKVPVIPLLIIAGACMLRDRAQELAGEHFDPDALERAPVPEPDRL